MAILEEVREIVIDQLDVNRDAVKEDSILIEDLGVDSLDSIELIMAIEAEFDIEITDDEAEKIKTVKDIVLSVEAKTKS